MMSSAPSPLKKRKSSISHQFAYLIGFYFVTYKWQEIMLQYNGYLLLVLFSKEPKWFHDFY